MRSCKKNKERVRDGSSSNTNNICQNTITGKNGAKDVGLSNFANVVVQGQGGGKEMKGFPERGGDFNISGNTITGDGVCTRKIGIGNFGNTTCSIRDNYPQNEINKTGGATDVGISPQGSSDTVWTDARGSGGKKPKGDGEDISGNKIKGDGAPKGFHNFSNTNKTTNEEDSGVTSNIRNNTITAVKGAKRVGLSNFHNVNRMSNASQGQGGREGREDFPKHNPSAIGHNIRSNKIIADGSEKVGFNNFGNTNITKDHVKAASSDL